MEAFSHPADRRSSTYARRPCVHFPSRTRSDCIRCPRWATPWDHDGRSPENQPPRALRRPGLAPPPAAAPLPRGSEILCLQTRQVARTESYFRTARGPAGPAHPMAFEGPCSRPLTQAPGSVPRQDPRLKRRPTTAIAPIDANSRFAMTGTPRAQRSVRDYRSVGSLPSSGAPVPEDPINSLRPSGNVISLPFARSEPSFA